MKIATLTLAALLSSALLLSACSEGRADDDRDDQRAASGFTGWLQRVAHDDDDADTRTRLQTAADPRYTEECGACHLAFPPGLLSRADTARLFDGLDDHFGDNASLGPRLTADLRTFALANAGWNDRATTARSDPPRITTTPWFVREHDEVPARLVTGNPEVGTFVNCTACHTRAEAGSFREGEIDIAGHGRWDD
ncbi:MAG: cytochrome C [Gammaproteobacteria bacterium]|nr:cytochrome C [Gammaproteobacteria bacterium]